MSSMAFAAATFFVTLSASASPYIYKYTDSTGKIVYTDNLPSGEKGQYSVLSSKSGTIKKVVEKELDQQEIAQKTDEENQQKKLAEQSEVQKKKDVALLSTYSNASEIDKMKQYELNQIDQAMRNNIDIIAALKDKSNQLEAAMQTAPNNKNFQADYNKAQGDLKLAQQTLESNKDLYTQRSQKYDEDKSRYLEILKQMGNNPALASSAAAASAPTNK